MSESFWSSFSGFDSMGDMVGCSGANGGITNASGALGDICGERHGSAGISDWFNVATKPPPVSACSDLRVRLHGGVGPQHANWCWHLGHIVLQPNIARKCHARFLQSIKVFLMLDAVRSHPVVVSLEVITMNEDITKL